MPWVTIDGNHVLIGEDIGGGGGGGSGGIDQPHAAAAKALHEKSIAHKDAKWWNDYMGGLSKPASEDSTITVYRGVPQGASDKLRPFDFVATDPKTARAYAGTTMSKGMGKVISQKVPVSEIYQGDLGAAYDDFRWVPKGSNIANAKFGVGIKPMTYGQIKKK